jgi:hypothetical protein
MSKEIFPQRPDSKRIYVNMSLTNKITAVIFLVLLTVSPFSGGRLSAGSPEGVSFDSNRYIDVGQIKRGMEGYGLTVFEGTKVEKFDVVAVSVVHNYNPKRDAILIRCKDSRFDIAKGVQGISGSPVFFEGKMAGAMAYGYPFGEEPLYIVTPIREMLEPRSQAGQGQSQGQPVRQSFQFDKGLYQDLMRESLLQQEHIQRLIRVCGLGQSDPSNPAIVLPQLTIGNVDAGTKLALEKYLPGINIQTAAIGAGIYFESEQEKPQLIPGAVLTIPLITGDISAAVLGAVTEVIGEDVYGFGHPWNGDGPTQWPMATGYVHTIVSSKYMSFKLGQPVEIVGKIQSDQQAAVYGKIGPLPTLIPVTVTVSRPYLDKSQTVHANIAPDDMMDPTLATMVTIDSLLSAGILPQQHTIEYQLQMNFSNVEPISFTNITSANDITQIVADIFPILALLLNNPWQAVELTDMTVTATILNSDHVAMIKSAQLKQRTYQPGEKINCCISLEPYRLPEQTIELPLTLPEDMPEGKYTLSVGGYLSYRQQLQKTQPHRFAAFTAKGLRDILQERLSIPRNNLYASIPLPSQNLSLNGTELPDLPPSKAMILTDPSRQEDIIKFQDLTCAKLETDYVIINQKSFEITVERTSAATKPAEDYYP